MDIAPIQWKEWEEIWWYDSREGSKPMWCQQYGGELPGHSLTELGHTSNGYRYTVYYKGKPLMTTIIRTPCCMQQGRCPVGKWVLPDTCRAYQRGEARKAAQVEWEQFVQRLAGGGDG